MLTTILLLVGALLSLLKGFDWEEATPDAHRGAARGVPPFVLSPSRLTELPFSRRCIWWPACVWALRPGCCCSPIRTCRTAINCGGSSPSTPTPRPALAARRGGAVAGDRLTWLLRTAPGDSSATPDELDRAAKS
jgi:phosphatidylglycerol lysyltransferase